MSQQGIQRTAQLLQLIQQQFPAIAQAAETPGVELTEFLYGTFTRSGIQPTAEVWTMIQTLVTLIGPRDTKPETVATVATPVT
jgi:hypothetical protein